MKSFLEGLRVHWCVHTHTRARAHKHTHTHAHTYPAMQWPAFNISKQVTQAFGASQVALVVKNLPGNANVREVCSVSGLGRSPGGGQGSTLQYSCLETPMDRGAWGATVHGVTRVELNHHHHNLHDCQASLSMEFPSKNTGAGCHFLFQGIFPTQGSNLCLLQWQADS